ncbi:hypothetical protein RIdsm_01171 [Roseovarius indicus]|uniref:Uncharacterized protein n=1 Tax=Roseovarius indicus TaxID=540747 RepID=A0A5P3AAQ8_9RHOB|nr:hypothetical protein RIdsm_01171 [Roseovarius indicus]SFE05966.1 hypothetical protein SAMN04488031_104375 [Roseovarius indicus]
MRGTLYISGPLVNEAIDFGDIGPAYGAKLTIVSLGVGQYPS